MQDFFDARQAPGQPGEGEYEHELRDYEYFSGLCSRPLRQLRARVEAACDRLDYKDSPIYDEYPDRIAIVRICMNIVEEIRAQDGQKEPFFMEDRGLMAASAEAETPIETYELKMGRREASYSGTVVMGNPGTYRPRDQMRWEPQRSAPGPCAGQNGYGRISSQEAGRRAAEGEDTYEREPWKTPELRANEWRPPHGIWGPPDRLEDLVMLLLLGDIRRRRCRHRRCR